jgi:hypothetical protein
MPSSSQPSWEDYATEVKRYDPLDIDIEKKRQRFEEHILSTDLVEKDGHRIEVKALTVPTLGKGSSMRGALRCHQVISNGQVNSSRRDTTMVIVQKHRSG